ncbi:MAG: hypothetical protein Q8O84_02205 [Nanoarchaeota archaeon]|nr:hypothetical protein [Nanoarchaeota archaeon]
MTNEETNIRYELMKAVVEKAKQTGDFKTQIFLAEELGLYFHAGEISMRHGYIKRAYENFKKFRRENFLGKKYCKEPLEIIEQMISSGKFLKKGEIEDNEYYHDRGNLEIKREYDIANKNKRIEKLMDEGIIKNLRKYEKGNEFSRERIRIYN